MGIMQRPSTMACALAILASIAPAQHVGGELRCHGRALDVRGRPVEGVEVRVVPTGERLPGPVLTRTAVNGTFSTEVPGGAGSASLVQLARGGLAAMGASIATANGVVDVGDVVLFHGVALQGVVRDPDGEPIADAVVVATDAVAAWATRMTAGDGWGGAFLEPAPYAATTTGVDGHFEIAGVLPLGTVVRAEKPGYATRWSAPLGRGARAALTLEPTGFVRGTVVDRAGRPIANVPVTLHDEAGNEVESRSAADGSFTIGLPSHTRYRVVATEERDFPSTWYTAVPDGAVSDWHSEPADDVRLVPLPLAFESTFRLRVVDAEDGQPVAGAVGSVAWFEERKPLPAGTALEGRMEVPAPAEGEPIRLHGPQLGAGTPGVVGARAPGYPPHALDVTWHDGLAPVMKLHRGVRVHGAVVDEKTGQPVGGQTVRWSVGANEREPADTTRPLGGRIRCGGDGRFTCEVPPGDWRFGLADRWRQPGDAPKRTVTVRAGEPVDDLRIRCPSGVTVSGSVAGATHPDGTWVRLLRGPVPHDPLPGVLRRAMTTLRSRLDADGRFAFHRVLPGSWRLDLMIPWPQLGAYAHAVPVRGVDVGADDLELSVTSPATELARVSGTVERRGAAVPTDRLVVVATPASGFDVYHGIFGPRSYVDATGDWSFVLPGGGWKLRVFDATTGCELSQPVPVQIGSEPVEPVELRVACGEVRVRCLPAAGDDPFVGQAVKLPGAAHMLPAGSVPARSEEQVLYLPAGAHRLEYFATRSRPPAHSGLSRSPFRFPIETVILHSKPGEVVEIEFRAPAR